MTINVFIKTKKYLLRIFYLHIRYLEYFYNENYEILWKIPDVLSFKYLNKKFLPSSLKAQKTLNFSLISLSKVSFLNFYNHKCLLINISLASSIKPSLQLGHFLSLFDCNNKTFYLYNLLKHKTNDHSLNMYEDLSLLRWYI